MYTDIVSLKLLIPYMSQNYKNSPLEVYEKIFYDTLEISSVDDDESNLHIRFVQMRSIPYRSLLKRCINY